MKLRFETVLMMSLFLLAGCGREGAATKETDAIGFTSTITGAVETELNGRGYVRCDDSVGELAIGANGGLSNNILILLPRGAGPGTYEIVSEMTPTQASAGYVGQTIQDAYYDRDVSGTVTLDAVPAKNGERAAGSFTFTASDRDDKVVTVTGSFDFNVDAPSAFINCSGE